MKELVGNFNNFSDKEKNDYFKSLGNGSELYTALLLEKRKENG